MIKRFFCNNSGKSFESNQSYQSKIKKLKLQTWFYWICPCEIMKSATSLMLLSTYKVIWSLDFLPYNDILNLQGSVTFLKFSKMYLPYFYEWSKFVCLYYRVTSLCQCIQLLSEYKKIYSGLPSFKEIFSPILHMCNHLPKHNYPSTLQVTIYQ